MQLEFKAVVVATGKNEQLSAENQKINTYRIFKMFWFSVNKKV